MPTKKIRAKIAAAKNPDRIDRYNTSNISLETQRDAATNQTSLLDNSRTRTQHHPEIESRLNSAAPAQQWIPIVSVNLNPGTQWTRWNASLLSDSSHRCFGHLISVCVCVSFFDAHLFSPTSTHIPLPFPSRIEISLMQLEHTLTRRDLLRHTRAIHHSICEPLCRDKRFCVPRGAYVRLKV